jgi:hypothetical protein
MTQEQADQQLQSAVHAAQQQFKSALFEAVQQAERDSAAQRQQQGLTAKAPTTIAEESARGLWLADAESLVHRQNGGINFTTFWRHPENTVVEGQLDAVNAEDGTLRLVRYWTKIGRFDYTSTSRVREFQTLLRRLREAIVGVVSDSVAIRFMVNFQHSPVQNLDPLVATADLVVNRNTPP